MSSTSDEHGPLPPGWVTQVSRSTGQRYWFNTKTGESRYTRPVPPGELTFHYSPPVAPPQASVLSTSHPQTQYQQHQAPYGYQGQGPPQQQQPPYGYGNQSGPDAYGNDAKRQRLDQSAQQFTQPPYGSYGGYPAAAPSSAPPYAYPPGPPAPQAAPPSSDAAVALAVASAYDHLTDQGIAGRRSSSILHLKNFNNWVKAVLIAEHAPRPCGRVLDLACGKLGDLQKWRLAGARSYCGIDISRTAVDDARARFNEANARSYRGAPALVARLARADLGVTDLEAAGVLEPEEAFDAISIQFALHYLFQSEARALAFFRNIAGRLAPGGVFVGTIPDAAYLVRRLREELAVRERQAMGLAPDNSNGQADGDGAGESGGGSAMDRPVSFGNSIYSVAFPPESLPRQFALGPNPYGLRYTFYLAESVDHIDEYLVPWQLLERLAAAAGLVPVAKDNFHDFFRRMIVQPGHRATARTMRIFDCEGTLSPEEWEAAGVYRVFAFRRPGPGEAPPAPVAPLPPWEDILPPERVAAYAASAAARPQPVPYKYGIEPEDVRDTIGV